MEFEVNPPPALARGDPGLATKATWLGMMGLGEGRGLFVGNTYRLPRYKIYSMGGKGQVIWISAYAAQGALPTSSLQRPQPTGGVATSPLFQLHQGDTVIVLRVNARSRALGTAQPASGSRVHFVGGARGRRKRGRKKSTGSPQPAWEAGL